MYVWSFWTQREQYWEASRRVDRGKQIGWRHCSRPVFLSMLSCISLGHQIPSAQAWRDGGSCSPHHLQFTRLWKAETDNVPLRWLLFFCELGFLFSYKPLLLLHTGTFHQYLSHLSTFWVLCLAMHLKAQMNNAKCVRSISFEPYWLPKKEERGDPESCLSFLNTTIHRTTGLQDKMEPRKGHDLLVRFQGNGIGSVANGFWRSLLSGLTVGNTLFIRKKMLPMISSLKGLLSLSFPQKTNLFLCY